MQKTAKGPIRLHIGCGPSAMPGWVNIDIQPLPGVDHVLDIRDGLPFHDVTAIYAEHFLEHLQFDDALSFLRECRRVLAFPGVLRLSTPNLDWVMQTHYRFGRWASDEEAIKDCLGTNLAFRGWGHQFLYNRYALTGALRVCGFSEVSFQLYGESSFPDLRGLERHEKYPDLPDLPHVLVVDAWGVGTVAEELPGYVEEFRGHLNAIG